MWSPWMWETATYLFKRVADLMAEKNAQLWINHDKPQTLGQKRSPEYYE